MAYSIKDPPDKIKGLPKHGKEIWIDAYNSAYEKNPDDEEKSNKIAWAAVKKDYEQDESGKWRAMADTSLGEIEQTIRDALYVKYPSNEQNGYYYLSGDNIFPGYIIYEKKNKWYKLTYSIVDGKVSFSDNPVEVEHNWKEIQSQQSVEEEYEQPYMPFMRMVAEQDIEGYSWEVVICEAGPTKRIDDGYQTDITDESLKSVADDGLFNNIDVNLFEFPSGKGKKATHLPDELFDIKPYLIKNKVAVLDKVRYVAGSMAGEFGKLVGVVTFLDSYKWLGKNILEAKKKGQSIYGLSYDAITRAIKSVVDNKPTIKIKKFLKPDSLDIVTRPAAGGAFTRAVASRKDSEDVYMNKEKIWALLEKQRPDLLIGRTLAGMTDEQAEELLTEATKTQQVNNIPNANQNQGQGTAQRSVQDELNNQLEIFKSQNELAKKATDALNLSRCTLDLDNTLRAADLPDFEVHEIKNKFQGRIFEKQELDTAITERQSLLSHMEERFKKENQPGFWIPGAKISGGLDTLGKVMIAADKLFGNSMDQLKTFRNEMCIGGAPKFDDFSLRSVQDLERYSDVPAFSGIKEMYVTLTGDPEIRGVFSRKNLIPGLRSSQDITSQSFTYILGNTLHRRVVSTYRETDWGEGLLISTKKNVKDFRTQEATLMGYFPDIETVDPETEDYSEIASVTDEEATYSILTKGHILTVTEKFIINDDTTALQKLVVRFGRAFRHTHAQYVWNFWINNSNCSDGTAWHTSGHGNLGASALSFSTFATAWVALAKMTEKDSGSRLGLLDDPSMQLVLVYSPDNYTIANTIINASEYWETDQQETTKRINPYKGRVTGKQNSLLTDTNDWGAFLPKYIDHLEIGYLNGREEPDFYTADSPQSEQVFVADKIRYKGKMRIGGTPVDFRGSYKAEVA